MKVSRYPVFVIALCLLAIAGTAIAEKPADKKNTPATKVETRTVTASMGHDGKAAGINAEHQPGEFTIKKGETAYDFKYSFTDNKQNINISHNGPGNIYSVTKRKYVATAAPNPGFTLGEGQYKFFVGGTPGATGSLTFKVKNATDADQPVDKNELAKNADRIIETVSWMPEAPNVKTKGTFYVRGNKVSGIIDQQVEEIKNEHFTCESSRYKGTFIGTIAGDVIKGTWSSETLPHRVVIRTKDGKTYGRKDWVKIKTDSIITLKKGGTLTETIKATGTSSSQWDANAPDQLAGKSQANKFDFTIPGEYFKQPIQGTWTEKKPIPVK